MDNRENKEDSILALRGLGKDIWEGVDPDEYVRELREDGESQLRTAAHCRMGRWRFSAVSRYSVLILRKWRNWQTRRT